MAAAWSQALLVPEDFGPAVHTHVTLEQDQHTEQAGKSYREREKKKWRGGEGGRVKKEACVLCLFVPLLCSHVCLNLSEVASANQTKEVGFVNFRGRSLEQSLRTLAENGPFGSPFRPPKSPRKSLCGSLVASFPRK